MGWFRRNKKNDTKEHGKPPRQTEEKIDIENANSNMSADGSTMSSLSNEQVEDCKEAFSVFVNEEGLVDIQKIGPMIRALGDKITDDEVQVLTDEYDHKHFEKGGFIDFHTFMDLVKPRIIAKNEIYNDISIDKLFNEFDVDGNGYISASELRQSLHKLGKNFRAVAEELTDEDVEEIMIESDLDGDGQISYSEFVIMIPRLNQIIEG